MFLGRRRPTHYRVCHASVRGVKPFRPFVPDNGLIPAEHIRAWLLTKVTCFPFLLSLLTVLWQVLNAERAAMYAPEFSQKLRFENKKRKRKGTVDNNVVFASRTITTVVGSWVDEF